jgi:hypothetical protein
MIFSKHDDVFIVELFRPGTYHHTQHGDVTKHICVLQKDACAQRTIGWMRSI